MTTDMHKEIVDKLITESSNIFKQYILTHTSFSMGQDSLSEFDDSVCIEATVGLNIHIEPIPMGELKHYKEGVPNFLLEIFHGKLVQAWNECLSNLFKILVNSHFSGERTFYELKKRNITLNFAESVRIDEQINERLCKDFEFEKYSDKAKLLTRVFNEENRNSDHLFNILKNVQIRNSFQHRSGKIDKFLLKELGVNKISILNKNGESQNYSLDDDIDLSVSELNGFRQSLIMVSQVWRQWNG